MQANVRVADTAAIARSVQSSRERAYEIDLQVMETAQLTRLLATFEKMMDPSDQFKHFDKYKLFTYFSSFTHTANFSLRCFLSTTHALKLPLSCVSFLGKYKFALSKTLAS